MASQTSAETTAEISSLDLSERYFRLARLRKADREKVNGAVWKLKALNACKGAAFIHAVLATPSGHKIKAKQSHGFLFTTISPGIYLSFLQPFSTLMGGIILASL